MKILQLHNYTQNTTGYKSDEEWIGLNNPETDCQRCAWEAFNKSKQHEVIVASLTPDRQQKSIKRGHTEYVFFPAALPNLYIGKIGQFSFHLLNYILQNQIQYVVFHSIGGFFNYHLSRRLKRQQIPYAIYFHWRPKKHRLDFFANFFHKRIIENAALLMVQTSAMGEYLQANYRVDKAKVYGMPMGIRTDWFKKKPAKKTKGYPRLLTVARIVKNKGILEAVACLNYIKKEFPEAVLELAGIEQDPDYAQKVRKYIADHQLEQSVIFSGYVDNEKLPEKYNSADLMIFPSNNEGLAKAVIESMACQVPVVAIKNSGGPDEIIQDHKDGWLVSYAELNQRVPDSTTKCNTLTESFRRS
jgi:glycosyltransferase involved in cell wall biosynthesis